MLKQVVHYLTNLSNAFDSSKPKDLEVDLTPNMRLAFYKAEYGTLKDKFIAKVINSKYSHVEIVFSDDICASASPRDKGVRFKKINLNNGKWDIYPIKQGVLDETETKQWFLKHLGEPYDTLGAIGSGINVPMYALNKKFCSLCLALIFNFDNINLNPESLRQILIKKGYIHPEPISSSKLL